LGLEDSVSKKYAEGYTKCFFQAFLETVAWTPSVWIFPSTAFPLFQAHTADTYTDMLKAQARMLLNSNHQRRIEIIA